MPRTRQPLDLCKEGPLVRERLRTTKAGPQRERLRAVQLGLEGELDLEQIAHAIGRARSVIQEWFL